jgi:undecaprenyl diphosphate synthase
MALTPGPTVKPAELDRLSEAELRAEVLARPLPRHVAIIMDGNGRWATRRGLPRVAGHREGVKAVRAVVRAAGELGVGVLTLYAFSSENWQRPTQEVATLMTLLQRTLSRELPELMARRVRFRVIGRAEGVPVAVQGRLARVVQATAANDGLTVVMAFNYGARDELVDACRRLAREVQAGRLRPEDIDEARLAGALYTHDLPDPDLLVRTSGELRVSNFLLWQIAYTELWVTPTLWPDFGARELLLAIAHYQRRHRRFGRVS